MKRGQSGDRSDDNFQTGIQRIRNYHKYHNMTLDFLREENVPVVFLDCSTTPDGLWAQLRSIGRLMRSSVRFWVATFNSLSFRLKKDYMCYLLCLILDLISMLIIEKVLYFSLFLFLQSKSLLFLLCKLCLSYMLHHTYSITMDSQMNWLCKLIWISGILLMCEERV